jgi:hypothetical protein
MISIRNVKAPWECGPFLDYLAKIGFADTSPTAYSVKEFQDNER